MLCFRRPQVKGTPPSTRFRHTTAIIQPSPGTPLDDIAREALGPASQVDAGDMLFCLGGYNTTGEEFGADSTFVSPSLKAQSQLHFHLGLFLHSNTCQRCLWAGPAVKYRV